MPQSSGRYAVRVRDNYHCTPGLMEIIGLRDYCHISAPANRGSFVAEHIKAFYT